MPQYYISITSENEKEIKKAINSLKKRKSIIVQSIISPEVLDATISFSKGKSEIVSVGGKISLNGKKVVVANLWQHLQLSKTCSLTIQFRPGRKNTQN